MQFRLSVLSIVLHHYRLDTYCYFRKTVDVNSVINCDSKHFTKTDKCTKTDWLAPAEGTSHPYVTSSHIDAVCNRIEGTGKNTVYCRRVPTTQFSMPSI